MLTVEVDLDPVAGFGATAESWREHLQGHLDRACPWYHPTVTTAPRSQDES
jgi:heat shock protein HspQ